MRLPLALSTICAILSLCATFTTDKHCATSRKLSAKISQCKLVETSASSSQADKIKASKERETMEKIVSEVNEYERDILYPLATERKEIDLDDGVKVNYLKFGKALKDFGLKAKK